MNNSEKDKELDLALDYIIDQILSENLEGFNPEIETETAFRARMKEKLKDGYLQYFDQMSKGFFAIVQTPIFPKTQAESYTKKFSAMRMTEAMAEKMINEELSLAELMDIDAEFLEKAYEAANLRLDQKKYEEASTMFQFLAALNPTVFQYYLGLGICASNMGKHAEALQCYLIALDLADDEGVTVLLWIVDELIEIGKLDDALICVEDAIQFATDKEQWKDSLSIAEAKKKKIMQLKGQ